MLPTIAVILGLIALIWSADVFIDGSSETARHLGIPPLLVGLFVIGFGTSAPELTVSIFAGLAGTPGLALGNAYGSNIANIALVLGGTALIYPLQVKSSLVRKEIPLLLGVTAISIYMASDLIFTRLEGILLLGIFLAFLGYSIRSSRQAKDSHDPIVAEAMQQSERQEPGDLKVSIIKLIGGLLILLGSSRALVWGATEIARSIGVSELIIGLTVVAIGTSLPELASTFAAARRREFDMAIGNIVGSNLFNSLLVVGTSTTLHPLTADADLWERDIPVMGGLSVLLLLFASSLGGKGRINRWEGGILFSIYVGYIGWLIAVTF